MLAFLLGTYLSAVETEFDIEPIPEDEPPEELVLPLREALQLGLQSNFSLRVETLNPRIALEDTAIAESVFDPQLGASVSWNESQSSQAASTLEGASQPQDQNMDADAFVSKRFSPGTEVRAGTGFNRHETNSSNALLDPDYRSEFGVQLRQPLLRNFGTDVNLAPVKRAKAGFQQSQIEYESSLADFFETLINAYWEVSAARRRLALNQSSVDLAKTILDRTQREFDLGLATRSDILQAQAELATRLEARLEFEKDLADQKDRLRFILGENLQNPSARFSTISLPEPPVETDTIAKILSEALAFDPDRRALEKQLDQRQYDLLISNNSIRPDLDLVLTGDYLGREDELGASYDQAWARDGYQWSAGLEVSFPWGFNEEKARNRQNLLRFRQTQIQIDRAEALVRQEVRTAWRQLENGRAQLNSARATVLLREEVLQAEEARRERGLSDISDVLDAARQLDDARLREVNATLATILAHTRLGQLDGSIFRRNGFNPQTLFGRNLSTADITPQEPQS